MEHQLAALRALAPHERFDTDPDTAPADGVEAIVAFRFAAGIAPRFPNLRLVASPGAGADELLSAGDIPAHVSVVRAIDPLQGRRMAQYVALMVLRHLRDLPRLESQHRRAEWRRFAHRFLLFVLVGADVLAEAVDKAAPRPPRKHVLDESANYARYERRK